MEVVGSKKGSDQAYFRIVLVMVLVVVVCDG